VIQNKPISVNVAFTIDNPYVQHCAVALTSLLENNPHLNFHIFIIHNGVSGKNQKLLTDEIQRYKAKIEFLTINEESLGKVVITRHITVATYFRLLLPNLLPLSCSKVLYLDVDMIVRHPIDEILDIDIAKFSHAAVKNDVFDIKHQQNLGMHEVSIYFNAGFLILNLDYWRANNITEKSLAYLKANREKIKYWDQDILNVVLEKQWYQLDFTWNVQTAFFSKSHTFTSIGVTKEEYDNVVKDPKILHFTGPLKPWFIESTHPFKSDYYKYLVLTPWHSAKPSSIFPLYKRMWRRLKTHIKLFLLVRIKKLQKKLGYTEG
jgi:lipopolysaccharide biosynthesis glycosyltransferase